MCGGGDQLAPLKPEAAIDFDTLFDFGDWLGVPSVECKERTSIVRAKVLHHLGKSCAARVYTVITAHRHWAVITFLVYELVLRENRKTGL